MLLYISPQMALFSQHNTIFLASHLGMILTSLQ
jgi:hypothetical protein